MGSCCFLFSLMILMRKKQGFMSQKFTQLITNLFRIEQRLGMQGTKTNIGNLPAKIEWIKIKYPAGDSTASLLVGTFHQLTEKCRRVNSDYWHQKQKWLEYFSIWHLPIVGIKLPWNFIYSNSCLPNADELVRKMRVIWAPWTYTIRIGMFRVFWICPSSFFILLNGLD